MTTWAVVGSLDSPTSGRYDLTSLSLSTYKTLLLICSGITVTTDGSTVGIQFYVSGTIQTGATSYQWGGRSATSASGANNDGDTSDPAILIHSNDATDTVGNAATKAISSWVYIDSPTSTSFNKRVRYHSAVQITTTGVVCHYGCGVFLSASAIDGIRVMGSSNLTGGRIRLLGLA